MPARAAAPTTKALRTSGGHSRAGKPQHTLQRRCACGGLTGTTGECAACRKKRLEAQHPLEGAPQSVNNVLNSAGQPLDAHTRRTMETRFGHDFGRVRIHADAAASGAARDVGAVAWSAGSRIAFGDGAYKPSTITGQYVLAHELAHVMQAERVTASGGGAGAATSSPPATPRIGAADSPAERDADRMAGEVMRGRRPAPPATTPGGALQRMVLVKPAALAGDMLTHFNKMCPGKFASQKSGSIAQIVGDCKTKDRTSSKSCECLCDTAHDKKRTYTITVAPAVGSEKTETLHDGTTAKIPVSSIFPSTFVGENPDITMPSNKGSSIEFGAFQPDGKPFWYENWRILAHELCGHGRLKQSGAKGEQTGCRAGHDATIDTENEIGAEHGSPKRGNFGDPRQGESFMNAAKKRGKVLFKQCTKGKKGGGIALHFEAP
jgi:hypothetical protein